MIPRISPTLLSRSILSSISSLAPKSQKTACFWHVYNVLSSLFVWKRVKKRENFGKMSKITARSRSRSQTIADHRESQLCREEDAPGSIPARFVSRREFKSGFFSSTLSVCRGVLQWSALCVKERVFQRKRRCKFQRWTIWGLCLASSWRDRNKGDLKSAKGFFEKSIPELRKNPRSF